MNLPRALKFQICIWVEVIKTPFMDVVSDLKYIRSDPKEIVFNTFTTNLVTFLECSVGWVYRVDQGCIS